ncbi:MAG: Uma2 family endonuclease [Candidatus Rokuibacteriota bacterium]
MASTAASPQALRRTGTDRREAHGEYERLVDLHVFEPGEHLELIDGFLLVREPQGSRHAAAIRRVLAALHSALGEQWQIDSQLPITLDDTSEPEPDVAVVLRDPDAYRDAHPFRALLVVEISESSYRIGATLASRRCVRRRSSSP